jgi:hypothetical protein
MAVNNRMQHGEFLVESHDAMRFMSRQPTTKTTIRGDHQKTTSDGAGAHCQHATAESKHHMLATQVGAQQ